LASCTYCRWRGTSTESTAPWSTEHDCERLDFAVPRLLALQRVLAGKAMLLWRLLWM